MIKKPPNFTDKEFIEWLQRWVLVNSWLYYEKDGAPVSDKDYDSVSRQLVDLQKSYKEDIKDTQYGYVFYDFDASTGFHLYYRLSDIDKEKIVQVASHIMQVYKINSNKKKKEVSDWGST